jgi:hypothetical protein
MAGSGELNVASVVALVLGGLAAFVLALVIALGGYGSGSAKKAAKAMSAVPANRVAPGASAEVAEAEGEYPLDTSEPATAR